MKLDTRIAYLFTEIIGASLMGLGGAMLVENWIECWFVGATIETILVRFIGLFLFVLGFLAFREQARFEHEAETNGNKPEHSRKQAKEAQP
jgi:hypothetical protein